MGLAFSIFEKSFGRNQMQIFMFGLDASGKTTILYKLKWGQVVSFIPTIGVNMETVEYKNIKLTTWDVGGDSLRRLICKPYYENSKGLIYVIDSSDRERIEYSKQELMKILEEEKLKDIPLLIYANKQDLKEVMSIQEMTEKLGLHTLQQDWFIQGTTALTGDGLQDGLNWLQNRISKK